MKRIKEILLFNMMLSFLACEQFDYNVYQTNRSDKVTEVTTAWNLDRLIKQPVKDTLHLILTGDTQRFNDDLEDLVDAANELPLLDALFIAGDLSDFATDREYEWLNRELVKLKVPFLTVPGNHDCLANGPQLYTEIYGPLNYSFTWNDIRFIMHNTNGREFSFNGRVPDISWMQNQLQDTTNYRDCIFVSHVPPYSADFDPDLAPQYIKLVREAKNTIFSVNGHLHNQSIGQPFNDGIWYVNTSSPSKRNYWYVTIYPYAEGKKFDCISVDY